MNEGIPCTWMRGGTSKGAYFLEGDLPAAESERDALLLAVMGSPDPRQIDGIGGADPLTSKVAVVAASTRPDADIEYLFLQVFVDRAVVTDRQNCGNILAGVAQFAVEKGLVQARDGRTEVAVHMVNSNQVAGVTIETPGGAVTYKGNARIDGVPGTAAPVLQSFPEAAGSTCGALLPTGNAADSIDGIEVTCIDNGMPVVVMRASDLDITGDETREALDANAVRKERLEAIRRQAGPLMNLGEVAEKVGDVRSDLGEKTGEIKSDLGEKVGKIEGTLDGMNKRIDDMANSLKAVQSRLGAVETVTAEINGKLSVPQPISVVAPDEFWSKFKPGKIVPGQPATVLPASTDTKPE